MREDTKRRRQAQIEDAAYAVLEEKGYAGASMLAIARRAKASNETLYNWYGDKLGLFMALVDRNVGEARASLEESLSAEDDALATLRTFGPILLGMLTGPRAVALNRAAAADPSGDLGHAIAKGGRETIAPILEDVFRAARAQGHLGFAEVDEAAELYLGLLIGDLQIRRVVGRLPAPTAADIERRSARALEAVICLMPFEAGPG
ncbi:TetR/AcrR family transcriptional regulator [Poseidonocella sedimentorum]|uniref:DNA-binding transcriptional regulator, AcrR family n=1 Tax=Poseidonocella sedimentorum TaxID=871652 RepID=A0A1I6CT68_9RHOB|nr:TetR/AcrR family transcriptional regulator [Poseidonocella sedimentorum]SFQ96398.1 DNA-binding transcriptional regulator, AcrR family [Poseidonocella sedimentorum]